MATGTHALKEEGKDDAPEKVEELGPSKPPAVIPGLGLVQLSSQEPVVNGQPAFQTTDVKMTDEDSKETAAKVAEQEPNGETQEKSEPAEAMDVDTKTTEAAPDNTQVAEQPGRNKRASIQSGRLTHHLTSRPQIALPRRIPTIATMKTTRSLAQKNKRGF